MMMETFNKTFSLVHRVIAVKLSLAEKASKMAIIDDAPDSLEHDAYAMGQDVKSGHKDT